jgi:hypothetical protein
VDIQIGNVLNVLLSPLFLTLATGGRAWLRDPRFNFLSNQVDWESLLQSPNGQGREYIISTSDEFFDDEFDPAGLLRRRTLHFM